MKNDAELTITRDQLRRRRHIVFNALPANVDARTPLQQYDAHVARLVAWAEKRAARR
jgi:hypothetical protein